MPIRKVASRIKKISETPVVEPQVMEMPKKRFSFPKINLPKSPTPYLVGLLIVASFLLGMLLTKVQYLEGQQGSNTGNTAGTQPAGAQPTTAPGTPVDVSVGNLPVLGNKDAKVKVIEFADFQCPFCEQWFSQVEPQIKKDYIDTGKIAFYWRDYPFLGQESDYAASAARCANEQGKFWEFHDYLYQHQGQENSGTFSKDNLKGFAASLGLNTDQFNSCLDADKYSKDYQTDLSDGQKAGVNGTPTVYVNGVAIVGAQPYTAFKSAIDQALSK
ncbi:MAG TPA: DsbA family protein [Patescibacteria group bacterium]